MPAQFSYMIQQPDGSVSTLQSEAARAPTWGELADHVASTGAQLLPATPAQQPATEQLSAPPPSMLPPATAYFRNPPAEVPPAASPEPAAAPPAPSLADRVLNVVAPERTFWSQLPSVGGAVVGAETGAAAGMLGGPAAPVTIPLGAIVGAGLGSGGVEAAQIGLERALGWQPAEAGTVGQRVGGAAIRGSVFETLPLLTRAGIAKTLAPIRWAGHVIERVTAPVEKVLSPAEWLASLPVGAPAAADPWLPYVSHTVQRIGSQLVGATPLWPGATTLLGPPPPGYAPPAR